MLTVLTIHCHGEYRGVFRESLKEEGLDAEVKHRVEHERMADIFRITKTINGEEEHIRQKIACDAASVARAFDEYLTERVEWATVACSST